MKLVTLSITLLLAPLIIGCAGGGEAAKIPNVELSMKNNECRGLESPSRIKVMACENYERECARREEDGERVCR